MATLARSLQWSGPAQVSLLWSVLLSVWPGTWTTDTGPSVLPGGPIWGQQSCSRGKAAGRALAVAQGSRPGANLNHLLIIGPVLMIPTPLAQGSLPSKLNL